MLAYHRSKPEAGFAGVAISVTSQNVPNAQIFPSASPVIVQFRFAVSEDDGFIVPVKLTVLGEGVLRTSCGVMTPFDCISVRPVPLSPGLVPLPALAAESTQLRTVTSRQACVPLPLR